MIDVKLLAVITLIIIHGSSSEYCKICPNHTLCKYPTPGPGPACVDYDESSLLTRHDTDEIVNRMNERRSFIALGLSKRLPQAANMRKLSWSDDLAWTAQRWADQCDPNIRPDKHDLCRNLDNSVVGQNIATIIGSSEGLNIKSFVDIWFMQILDYSGSITFYNETQGKTDEFTQLIWADTELVGCGKAQFFIELEHVIVHRLVCNFSPQGNVYGKPVYAIGLPATQCPEGYSPDDIYDGLCNMPTHDKEMKSPVKPTDTSLLQVVNYLKDNVMKKEIDPITYDLKEAKLDNNTAEQRSQKIRHVVNNSYADTSYLLPRPPQWSSLNSSRRQFEQVPIQHYPPYQQQQQQLQQGGGYSRMYHGHDHREHSNQQQPSSTMHFPQDFRRYESTTASTVSKLSTNYRKFFQNGQCTRNFLATGNVPCNACPLVPYPVNKCTRRFPFYGQCPSVFPLPPVTPPVLCPYSMPPIFRRNYCQGEYNCPCSNYAAPCYPKISRRQEEAKHDIKKSPELHYYDLLPGIPNLVMRSGEDAVETFSHHENVGDRDTGILSNEKILHLSNTAQKNEKNKPLPLRSRFHNNVQVKSESKYPKYSYEANDYDFDSVKRQKRSNAKVSTGLFRKNDESNRKSLLLKSLRYTTLLNRRKQNSQTAPDRFVTELITKKTESKTSIKESEENTGDTSNTDDTSHISTEKYLSFDELMHLRKMNSGNVNFRRQVKKPPHKPANLPPIARADPPPTSPPTPIIPTMTTFSNKRHCTRKLTCTWTAFTVTDSNGSVIHNPPGGGGGGHPGGQGTRTPPGYVEGCTRTSTCTREHMDRNKISTLVPISPEDPDATPEDEDYCERRALDVKKRNLEENNNIVQSKDDRTDILQFTGFSENSTDLYQEDSNCNCNSNSSRIKRYDENCCQKKSSLYENPPMSYGDLYYLVVNKFLSIKREMRSPNHSKKCQCNESCKPNQNVFIFLVYCIIYIVI